LRTLNLASLPFRNERLQIFLTTILVIVALGLTVRQAVALRRVMPAELGQTEAEIQALEAEIDRVSSDRGSLRDLNPTGDQLAQWGFLRELVDRRVFRWTVLLARLQELLPEGVRIVSVEPRFEKDVVTVSLSVTADTRGSGRAR
jgi:Tfp pilus assembly protein PilN